MRYINKSIFLFVLFFGLSKESSAQQLEKQFDELLEALYPIDEPGATAIVAINGEIVYHKAFGIANLELDVFMEPEMVFQMASITKQFTAVSILMLMEQGKLNLDDDVTKFIEDYPTNGNHISIHHLLTHTSGISRSITLNPWDANIRKHDFEPLEFIDYVKNEPIEFKPGEDFRYNNFGYQILGAIIEKASGQSYEEFVESNIFQKLDMRSASRAKHSDIVKQRAYGYEKQEDFVNAGYVSHTRAFAAGSLMSNVQDLLNWNSALLSNKLLKKETIELAFTNHTLNNGKKINYGYGWFVNDINGSSTFEHAGGDHGFRTNAIYLPEKDVFVAVFANCSCKDPRNVSTKMAALAIGKPYSDMKTAISVDAKQLQNFVGEYEFDDGFTRAITLVGNQLYSKHPLGSKVKIFPITTNSFFYENPIITIDFIESANGVEAILSNRIKRTRATKSAARQREIEEKE